MHSPGYKDKDKEGLVNTKPSLNTKVTMSEIGNDWGAVGKTDPTLVRRPAVIDQEKNTTSRDVTSPITKN